MEEGAAERLLEIGEKWNSFIENLIEASISWDEFMRLLIDTPRGWIEEAPIEVQKVAGRFRRIKFSKMLPGFVDFWVASGGLESMYADLSELEKLVESKEKGGK